MGKSVLVSVPDDSYIIDLAKLNTLLAPELYTVAAQGVVVSRKRITLLLAPPKVFSDLRELAMV